MLAAAGVKDGVTDAGAVGEDGGIPEAQDAQAFVFEVGGAAGVVGDLIGVLPAVEFDDEAGFEAEEVEEEGAPWDLAAPFPSAEAGGPQRVPEVGLGAGIVAPEDSCAVKASPRRQASNDALGAPL
jgi:hypothetical protein